MLQVFFAKSSIGQYMRYIKGGGANRLAGSYAAHSLADFFMKPINKYLTIDDGFVPEDKWNKLTCNVSLEQRQHLHLKPNS